MVESSKVHFSNVCGTYGIFLYVFKVDIQPMEINKGDYQHGHFTTTWGGGFLIPGLLGQNGHKLGTLLHACISRFKLTCRH